MSPLVKTTIFASVALASFAGAANAGRYRHLHIDNPLLGSAYDELSLSDLASDAELRAISKAAKAAMELIDDEDAVEEFLGESKD